MWTQRWFVSQEGPDFLVFQTPLPHSLDCTLLNFLRFLFILFNTISFSFPCFSLTFSSISIFLPHFSFFLLCFHFLSKAFSFLLPFNPCVYQVGRDPWLTLALFSFWCVWGRTESDATEAHSLQLYPTLCNPMEHQAPLSRRFSRQEYWSGLLFPPPGDLPDPGLEPAPPADPALQADSLPTEPSGKFIFLLETPPVAHNILCDSPVTVYNQFYEP